MGISSTCSTPIINFSGYYRKRVASVELPEATAWLEHLELQVRTVASTGVNVQYELRASYTPPCCQDAALVSSVTRPFDAYCRFRQQLLRRLQPGHACPAECKWLYAVVKNHFPKPKLLAANSPRTTEARRQVLSRVLRTLQASLVNRGNQGCDVLVQGVCRDLATFILGDNAKLPDVASGCSSDQSMRDSSASFMSDGSGDEDYSDEVRFSMTCMDAGVEEATASPSLASEATTRSLYNQQQPAIYRPTAASRAGRIKNQSSRSTETEAA